MASHICRMKSEINRHKNKPLAVGVFALRALKENVEEVIIKIWGEKDGIVEVPFLVIMSPDSDEPPTSLPQLREICADVDNIHVGSIFLYGTDAKVKLLLEADVWRPFDAKGGKIQHPYTKDNTYWFDKKTVAWKPFGPKGNKPAYSSDDDPLPLYREVSLLVRRSCTSADLTAARWSAWSCIDVREQTPSLSASCADRKSVRARGEGAGEGQEKRAHSREDQPGRACH
jgi:hypothetical protein